LAYLSGPVGNGVPQGTPTAKSAVMKDDRGTTIPEESVQLWVQRETCDHIAKQLSDLKCFFEKAHNEGSPLFRQMNCQDAYIKLEAIRYCVVQSKPHYVCRYCQGRPSTKPKGCPPCLSTGLMGKDRWKQTPEELRNFPVMTI
jgi:hypothetical protein